MKDRQLVVVDLDELRSIITSASTATAQDVGLWGQAGRIGHSTADRAIVSLRASGRIKYVDDEDG